LENWKHQLISYSLLQSKSRLEYSSRQPSYWHEPTNLAKGHAKHRLAGARPRILISVAIKNRCGAEENAFLLALTLGRSEKCYNFVTTLRGLIEIVGPGTGSTE